MSKDKINQTTKAIHFYNEISWSSFDKKITSIEKASLNGEVYIELKDIKIMDPAIFGWLYLLSKTKKCKITLDFITSDGNPDRYYEALHLMQILETLNSNITIKSSQQYIKKMSTSRDFFPIIPIDKNTYDSFFKVSFKDLIKDSLKVMQNDTFWQDFSGDKNKERDILKHINNKYTLSYSDDYNKAIYIFLSYYLQLLVSLKYFKGFIEKLTENCSENIKIKDQSAKSGITEPGFDKNTVEKYWRHLDDFLDQKILNKPPFFVIMLSLMVTNFKFTPALNITKPEGSLYQLYLLSNEYFYRILELVDNIIEHSTTSEGVIMSRVRKTGSIKSFYKDKLEYFSDHIFDNVSNFLEMSIMDIGSNGIISTSLERWNLSNEQSFNDDAEYLKTLDPIDRIKIFFKPENKYFNHQYIRTAACLGLLVFSSLIDLNKGFFEVWDRDKNADGYYYSQSFLKCDQEKSESNFWGVKYNILLPVDLDIVKHLTLQEFYV